MNLSYLRSRNLDLWVAPLLVLSFAVLLAMMYGWVGTASSVGGETAERPEIQQPQGRWVAAQGPIGTQPATPPAPLPGYPIGIGDGANGQMQLIGTPQPLPGYPVGIGQGANGQMQLIGTPQALPGYPVGIGQGLNGQMQLIGTPNDPALQAHHLPAPAGMGIGNGANGQMQLIKTPQYSLGIGNPGDNNLQLINRQLPVYIGARLSDVPDVMARSMGIATQSGLLIEDIAPRSPADKAGLSKGDVLLSFDRQKIIGLDPFINQLITKAPGDKVKVIYFRNGRQKSSHLSLVAPPGLVPAAAVAQGVTPPSQPWFGADVQNIDMVIQQQFKLKDRKGVIISHVRQQSPAAAAGLVTGDVITRFNGSKVKDTSSLQKLIGKTSAGQTVALQITRETQTGDISMVLGDINSAPKVSPAKLPPAEMAIEGTWIGMDVSPLDPKDAADFGFPAGTSGILVNDVESPPASTVGFTTGDLITAINGTPTPTMKQFVASSKLQTGAVVDVMRGSTHIFITVPPPGVSQQGTPIVDTTGPQSQQVAFTQQTTGRLAILSAGPTLGSIIVGDRMTTAYIIIVDLSDNSFSSVNMATVEQLSETLKKHQVIALIGNDISGKNATKCKASGIQVFTGVVGASGDAIQLYRSNSLVALK
nr:PDZ domain-containing protein [Desulfobulbaceae bacterium]